MAEDPSSSNSTTDSLSPHFIRITSSGKLTLWVEFSLKFFRENAGRPLVLHTLPINPSQDNIIGADGSSDSAINCSEEGESLGRGQTANEKATCRATNAATSASARNIPRLISVAEIIKREYFKALVPGPESTGLYQYNYLGFLEESTKNPDLEDNEDGQRQEDIAAALQGKRFLKQEKTPFMKITLCTNALSALDDQATCQLPAMKKLSRSARARQKRRLVRDARNMAEGA